MGKAAHRKTRHRSSGSDTHSAGGTQNNNNVNKYQNGLKQNEKSAATRATGTQTVSMDTNFYNFIRTVFTYIGYSSVIILFLAVMCHKELQSVLRISNSLPNSDDSLQNDGAVSETSSQVTPGASSMNPSPDQQDQNILPKSEFIGKNIFIA